MRGKEAALLVYGLAVSHVQGGTVQLRLAVIFELPSGWWVAYWGVHRIEVFGPFASLEDAEWWVKLG